MTFRAAVSALVLSLCLVPAFSQKTRPAVKANPATPAGMTNDDVIGLAGAGMSDEVIVAKIHAAPSTSFDTSLAGLKALKAANVSSKVVAVMIDPKAVPAAPTATVAAPVAAAPVANADDPMTVHSPGIYILAAGADGKVHLTKLDHITAKTTKTSGIWKTSLTYGIAKAHVTVAIDGPHASIQTVEPNPVFYAYIPEDNTSFGGNALTVKDFFLIKLEPKDAFREVNTATISPWGSSSGADQKARQGFTSETVTTGVYKLKLDQPLAAGQYAFQHTNYGAFFDFGILANK